MDPPCAPAIADDTELLLVDPSQTGAQQLVWSTLVGGSDKDKIHDVATGRLTCTPARIPYDSDMERAIEELLPDIDTASAGADEILYRALAERYSATA